MVLTNFTSAQGTLGNSDRLSVFPDPYSKSDFITKGSQMSYFERFLIEKRLELILQENIVKYVHPDLFFVSVHFDNEDFETIEVQSESGQATPASSPPSIGRDRADFLKVLPGLPQYRRNPPVMESMPKGTSLEEVVDYLPGAYETIALNELRNLRVHFLLDTLIDVGMEDLFRKLTLHSLKMPDDGTVQVSFERVPLYGLFAALRERDKSDSLRIGIDLKNQGGRLFESDKSPMEELWSSPWSYLGLALLGLLLVYLGYRLFGRGDRPDPVPKRPEISLPADQALEKTVNITKNLTEVKGPFTEAGGEADRARDFSDYFVRHTAEIGKVFSYWLEDLGEEGLSKVRSILRPMGKNVYALVYPYLSANAQDKLTGTLVGQLPVVSEEEREEAIHELMRMIDLKLGIDTMAFINSLPEEELFGILDQLDSTDAVLAFDYLDKSKVTAYMEHVPTHRVLELIIETNNLKVVSRDRFWELGMELSKKLAEVRTVKNYTGLDIRNLLDSFEDIDLDRQYEILNRMLERDLDMYHELKKSILMWADIGNLDKELVRAATQDFTARDLSLVHRIKGAEIQPVLDLRPEREQLLIYEMSGQSENVPVQEAEAISKRILKAIHSKMKEA
jgi:flagellar motor switch protein FliG